MVDDALLAREQLADEAWLQTPQKDHLVPDSVAREQERASFREALRDDPPAIVLTHDDADGLTSAALVTDFHGVETVTQTVSYHGAYQLDDALNDVRQHVASRTRPPAVYICDFSIDDRHLAERVADLTATDGVPVIWFDHHQWDDDIAQQLRDAGVDLLVDEDRCTATLIESQPQYQFGEYLQELAAVTEDIDLWIREDPRSPRLNVFASLADPGEYIGLVRARGPDFPEDVEARIDERLDELEYFESRAIDLADAFSMGSLGIVVTYIRDGRSSEIGNELVEHRPEFDIAVVQKPHGGMGIYSKSSGEDFARCHEIAAELGGGGHPTAAGCDAPIDTFQDLAYYWATNGELVRSDVFDAIRAVVNDGNDDPEDKGDAIGGGEA